MIAIKKAELDMSVLVKGALVMIAIIVVIFVVVKAFNIAADETNGNNDDYLDALNKCDSGDAHCKDKTLHQMLIRLDLPFVLGVIREVEEVTFNQRVIVQSEAVKSISKINTIDDLLFSGGIYEVE